MFPKGKSIDTAKRTVQTLKLQNLQMLQPMTRSITDEPKSPSNRGSKHIPSPSAPVKLIDDHDDDEEEDVKSDPENENENESKEEEPTSPRITEQSFGHKFNYINKEDEWYIGPRFEDLKQEIIGDLDLDRFDYTRLKAKCFMDCIWIRGLKSSINYNRIKCGDTISNQHVMALVLYTEYAILQQNVKNTFFKLSSSESDEMLKERNSNYHHICRLLDEAVVCFGSVNGGDSASNLLSASPNSGSIRRLYHCIDDVQFHRFDVDVHCPLSVTSQIEIAINCVAASVGKELIGGDGIILELKGSSNLAVFDCSALSAYGNENEQLLFAMTDRVQIGSIRKMNEKDQWVKFRSYLSVINLYDDLLRHKGSPKRPRGGPSDDIIAQQIEWILEDKPSTPSFISTHFDGFCGNHREIQLDIGYMIKYYPAVSRSFVAESGQWLRYENIARVHRNCLEICTSSFQPIEISNEYLEAVLSMVDELNATKLQRIYVLNPNKQCNDEELTSFGDQFKEKGWKLGLNGGKLSISKMKGL